MSVIERDLAGRDGRGFPHVVKAGPFLFSRACDGGDGEIGVQCTRAYAALGRIFESAGSDLNQVVRLDHFTESQGWLPERQRVRAQFFGRPASLASTGVAARLQPPNLLRVAAIALAAGEQKQVLVDGASFGMPAISSVVAGGGHVFLSGILNDGGWASSAEPGQTEFVRQAQGCFATIGELLRRAGAPTIVRQDVYVSEREEPGTVESALRAYQPPAGVAIHGIALPFGGTDLLEVTTIARIRPAESLAGRVEGTLGFLTATSRSREDLIASLIATLKHAALALDRVLRLDVCLPDADQENALCDDLVRLFGAHCPVVVPVIGRSLGAGPFSLSAIVAAAGASS